MSWLLVVVLFISLDVVISLGLSATFSSSVHDIDNIRQQWERNCLLSLTSGRPGLKKDCVVYYLHNHKTGGTTMCHTALKSGMKITTLQQNCNVPPNVAQDDQRKPHLGIAYDYIRSFSNISFVAQEHIPFHPNLLENKFIYITTIRHPVDRLISELHHGVCGLRTPESAQDMLNRCGCSIRNVTEMTLSDLIMDDCFGTGMSRFTTNFYISTFTDCIRYGKEGTRNICNNKHLTIAKEKLHLFSVIIMTDTSYDFNRYCQLLGSRLPIHFEAKYRSGTKENSNEKSSSLRRNESVWNKVVSLNSLDIDFYFYAKQVAESLLSTNLPDSSAAKRKLFDMKSIPFSPVHKHFEAKKDLKHSSQNPPLVYEEPFCSKFNYL